MILSFEGDTIALREYLNETQQVLLSYNNNTLIIDARRNAIADITGLGLESELNIEAYHERNKREIDNHMETSAGLSVLACLLGLFGQQYSGEQEQDQNKKRKRKRKLT
jgi:hypothetical protein